MASREENIRALKDIEGFSLIFGLTPSLIVGPTLLGTSYINSISMFGAALAMKRIGVL